MKTTPSAVPVRSCRLVMKDKQIIWIVVFAVLFWLAAWKHEDTANLLFHVSRRLTDLFR